MLVLDRPLLLQCLVCVVYYSRQWNIALPNCEAKKQVVLGELDADGQ
jgi:hypothetical protein